MSAFALGALLSLGGCGQSADNPPAGSETESPSTTEAPDPAVPSTGTTATTYPIEVVQFAEAYGASLEEAAALLEGQLAQNEGLDRLRDLVGEDVIVGAAFGDYPRSDELTVFVVDVASVAVVEAHVIEAGLDPEKTFAEVAPEESPYDPWDWLESERYAGYEWLESPGPHIFGAWELVESNGVAPQVPLWGGFGASWSLEACSSWLGRVLTTAEGTVTLTVDRTNVECDEATATFEELVLSVIVENSGEFEVLSEEDGRMTWESSAGDTLVWQPLDESLEPGEPPYPVYPTNRPAVYEAWARSPAAEMEGIWYLQQVNNEEPAAPVSIGVGVSTIGFEGQCNDMGGVFAISQDDHLGLSLFRTDMFCSGPTGEVEEQISEALWGTDELLQVSVDDNTMTWSNEAGTQMMWSR